MYRIVDWVANFENNRTKELKALTWVPMPNKHDGDGYTELVDHEDGAAHYGVWCAIVAVASKCDTRGTLLRDGARPHDARSLARIIRMKEGVVSAAIARLVNDVRWLEVIPDPQSEQRVTEIPQEDAARSQESAPRVRAQEGNGREWKGTEGKGMEVCAASAAGSDQAPGLHDWLCWWNSLKRESLVPAGVNEDEPGHGVLAGWARVQKVRVLRELLADRDALEREIRASKFCRESWFRLEKLFGGKNRDGELIAKKLVEGGYRDSVSRASNARKPGDPRGNMAVAEKYLTRSADDANDDYEEAATLFRDGT